MTNISMKICSHKSVIAVSTFHEQTLAVNQNFFLIVYILLRLLVNLTTPPLILWNEEIPTDKNVRNYYMQIEEHLQSYKLSFADEGLWSVLSSRLSSILEQVSDDFF